MPTLNKVMDVLIIENGTDRFLRNIGNYQSTLRYIPEDNSSLTAQSLKKGPIGFSETSVANYKSTLRNVTEERRSHLHRGESLKSRIIKRQLCTLQSLYQAFPCLFITILR
jgi:hypothetical protein